MAQWPDKGLTQWAEGLANAVGTPADPVADPTLTLCMVHNQLEVLCATTHDWQYLH